jgi:hypothetical protein
VLASALLHERNYPETQAMLAEIIQNHAGTSSEVYAMYGRVMIALNLVRDEEVANIAVRVLHARYPEHYLTRLAEALVEIAFVRPGSMGAKKNGSLANSVLNVDELPSTYSLAQNYPNPFNPTTIIEYQLPEANHVELKVFDLLGREIATLVSENQEGGYYRVPFRADHLASGVYFYRLHTGFYVDTKKLLLMR